MEQKRTRRTFDPSFKHHAALRVVEGKEKAAAVAADLGINIVSLYNWVKDYEKTKATRSQTLSPRLHKQLSPLRQHKPL